MSLNELDSYRSRFGCLACGEDHPKESMCPPHEVRTTGQAWFKTRVSVLSREIEAVRWELRTAKQEIAVLRESHAQARLKAWRQVQICEPNMDQHCGALRAFLAAFPERKASVKRTASHVGTNHTAVQP